MKKSIKITILFSFLLSISLAQKPVYKDIYFYDNDHGWISANNGDLFITSDGGNKWRKYESPGGKFFFLNSNLGWILSNDSLYQSIYGDKNWNLINTFPELDLLTTLYFLNDSVGFLAGGIYTEDGINSKILKTTDAGINWHAKFDSLLFGALDPNYNSISFDNNGTGYFLFVLDLFKTDNFGETWFHTGKRARSGCEPGPGSEGFEKLQLINKDTLLIKAKVVCFLPSYYFEYSVDGGESWFRFGIGFGSAGDFHFFNLDKGYNLASKRILYTTNSGINYDTLQTFDWSGYLQKFTFINEQKAWGIGGSSIYFTTDGWYSYQKIDSLVTKIDNNPINLKSFTLSQNYPNPFNPQTTIQYYFPKTANVQLSIYDVNGRLVKTLVSQNQSAGEHEVTFNAADLASGIYYYRLQTDKFTQTLKMVLIR